MFNNRMLAVAAVLALAVPALGAAAPIVVPPVPEQLVEGHTVFTVIEARIETNVTEERFAAAVAVLVREYQAERAQARFPGVLWFNDQYLVNPEQNRDAVEAFRYPCGGAVLAVNAGDPDPRMVVAKLKDGGQEAAIGQDTNNGTWYGGANPNWYGKDDPSYNEYAWVGADTSGDVYSDTTLGSATHPVELAGTGVGADYRESYLITDPNDHAWIIDVYDFYHRTGTGGAATQVYSSTVWAVNTMGSPVFIPDDGASNCLPFYDLTDDVFAAQKQALCGVGPIGVDQPAKDDPCMGYKEPSDNGYCYGGQSQAAEPVGCDRDAKPLRKYNALLYFKLEDLTNAGATRDHSPASTDTNGCQTGTEWTCPGGDDNQEGNSHPFHPDAPAHTEAEPCPVGFDPQNPTNHGGSDTVYADCTYGHATRNIDVYFSGAGRPFAPAVRTFDVLDLEGSQEAFHDHHSAY